MMKIRCVSRLYKNGISDSLWKPIKAEQSVKLRVYDYKSLKTHLTTRP